MQVKIAKRAFFTNAPKGYDEVDGEPVVIHGFEDYEFALTTSLSHPGYTVTELSSGFAIGPDWDDETGFIEKEVALTFAALMLNFHGREGTARAIKSAIKLMSKESA